MDKGCLFCPGSLLVLGSFVPKSVTIRSGVTCLLSCPSWLLIGVTSSILGSFFFSVSATLKNSAASDFLDSISAVFCRSFSVGAFFLLVVSSHLSPFFVSFAEDFFSIEGLSTFFCFGAVFLGLSAIMIPAWRSHVLFNRFVPGLSLFSSLSFTRLFNGSCCRFFT